MRHGYLVMWRSRHKVTANLGVNQVAVCHGKIGESDTGAELHEEHQAPPTLKDDRHLTEDLMTEICSKSNLRRAYKQVKRNKGAAGVDGMTVDDMHDYFETCIEGLRASLLDGSYRPQEVLGINIPKPGGGSRQLGIPTVVDRVIDVVNQICTL